MDRRVPVDNRAQSHAAAAEGLRTRAGTGTQYDRVVQSHQFNAGPSFFEGYSSKADPLDNGTASADDLRPRFRWKVERALVVLKQQEIDGPVAPRPFVLRAAQRPSPALVLVSNRIYQ
jgi:hypothetical protein